MNHGRTIPSTQPATQLGGITSHRKRDPTHPPHLRPLASSRTARPSPTPTRPRQRPPLRPGGIRIPAGHDPSHCTVTLVTYAEPWLVITKPLSVNVADRPPPSDPFITASSNPW